MQDLETLKPLSLLRLHAAVVEELRRRGIVRSANNPVGDYAEHLFCRAFGWQPLSNSAKGADAEDRQGTRFQIKSRRLLGPHYSRQLSALRDLDKNRFDRLAAVLFEVDFTVLRAAIVPYDLVLSNSKHTEWTSSWRFELHDSVWSWPEVQDVTDTLLAAQAELS